MHTPGPWKINLGASDPYKWIGVESDQRIDNWNCMRALVECDDCNKEMAMANAHVVAAAPDLLDALEAIVPAFRVAVEQAAPTCNPDEHALIVRARAAIAKAKGGAS